MTNYLRLLAIWCFTFPSSKATTCDSSCQSTMPSCSDYSESISSDGLKATYTCNSCLNGLSPIGALEYLRTNQIRFLCDNSTIKECHTDSVCKVEFPYCTRVVVRSSPGNTTHVRYFCQKCFDGLFYPGGKTLKTTDQFKSVCGWGKYFLHFGIVTLLICLISLL